MGKDNKCRDIIRWKYVCCMSGKATIIKVNQLRYDSLSQKYEGTSVQVLIGFNGIVFLLVKLKSFSYLQSITWNKVIRLQRSGIDTIKYHTWSRIPMGKWPTQRRHHKREPRGQSFPSRWPQSTYKQTRTKHSKHKTEQKHKRSTKEVPPWNGQ